MKEKAAKSSKDGSKPFTPPSEWKGLDLSQVGEAVLKTEKRKRGFKRLFLNVE